MTVAGFSGFLTVGARPSASASASMPEHSRQRPTARGSGTGPSARSHRTTAARAPVWRGSCCAHARPSTAAACDAVPRCPFAAPRARGSAGLRAARAPSRAGAGGLVGWPNAASKLRASSSPRRNHASSASLPSGCPQGSRGHSPAAVEHTASRARSTHGSAAYAGMAVARVVRLLTSPRNRLSPSQSSDHVHSVAAMPTVPVTRTMQSPRNTKIVASWPHGPPSERAPTSVIVKPVAASSAV